MPNSYRSNTGKKNRKNNSHINKNSNHGQIRSGSTFRKPDEFRVFRLKKSCTSSGNNGHWDTDHMSNGTIEDNFPSIHPNLGDTDGILSLLYLY